MTINLSNSELLLQTTIRLESILLDGSSSVGTGFYFAFHKGENSWDRLAVVTNKHVVKNSMSLEIYLTPFDRDQLPNYASNFKVSLNIPESEWIMHPEADVDLCILPFEKFHDDLVAKY